MICALTEKGIIASSQRGAWSMHVLKENNIAETDARRTPRDSGPNVAIRFVSRL